MGSGKSTLGKKIASALNFDFLDLDAELEKHHQLSVNSIFEQKGENYFRILEKDWLSNIGFDNTLVSLGGGTPCFFDNMYLIKTKGRVIYLYMEPKVLANRLINSKTKRPLIEAYKLDLEALNEKVEELLDERTPFYEQADIIFEASNMTKTKMDLLLAFINASSQSSPAASIYHS